MCLFDNKDNYQESFLNRVKHKMGVQFHLLFMLHEQLKQFMVSTVMSKIKINF